MIFHIAMRVIFQNCFRSLSFSPHSAETTNPSSCAPPTLSLRLARTRLIDNCTIFWQKKCVTQAIEKNERPLLLRDSIQFNARELFDHMMQSREKASSGKGTCRLYISCAFQLSPPVSTLYTCQYHKLYQRRLDDWHEHDVIPQFTRSC